MPHPWKHSGSGWTRLWAIWPSGRCACLLQGGGTTWPLKIPSNPNYSMILHSTFFFPNTNQWTGCIHLNHKYQKNCHRKPVLKINTINCGHCRTLTKCSIDPLVALWAFHHRTESMVSWRKKLHQLNTADSYTYLESPTAKLLSNYKKVIISFSDVWLSIKGQEIKTESCKGNLNSISFHMYTT